MDAKGRHAGEPAGVGRGLGGDCYILRNTSHRPPHSPPTNKSIQEKTEDRESLTHSISLKSEIAFFLPRFD